MEKYLNKLPLEKEQLQKNMDLVSKWSFALGLFIELTIVLLDKSEYIIQYEGWWFRITFVLFGLSLLTVKHTRREWISFILFALMGVISYRYTGRNEILRAVVLIWACKGKDMKKVLRFTFWYTAAGCAVIFLLSVTGIFGALSQTAIYHTEQAWVVGEAETRYCFGMGHPNAFHCMMLALTWLGIYCYHEKIKWYGYVLLGAAHVVLYLFTTSRTGLLMSVCSLGLFILFHYVKPLQKQWFPYVIGILTIVGAVGFSVFMAKYSVFHPLLKKIDSYLSFRITNLYFDSINHEGMVTTWTLWSRPGNNNFFDLGIVRMFYWFGIIPAITYYLAQCRLIWCGYKKKDAMLLVLVVVITIYSLFEAHFISDYLGRNYLLLLFGMYLSDMLGEENLEE